MDENARLKYLELTKDLVTDDVVNDINHLLPQLTSSGATITQDWLIHVLTMRTRVFVAMDGDRTIGTVLLAPMVILVAQKDWIEDVVVDSAYRGLGVANQLMGMAESASRENGVRSVNLTSNPSRGPARSLYEKRGYELRDTGVFRLTQK